MSFHRVLCFLLALTLAIPAAFYSPPARSINGPFEFLGNVLGYDVTAAKFDADDARKKRDSAEAEALAQLVGEHAGPLAAESLVKGAVFPSDSADLQHARHFNDVAESMANTGFHGHQHELDTFGLLRQKEVLDDGGKPKFNYINPDRLLVEVTVDGEAQKIFNMGGRSTTMLFGQKGTEKGLNFVNRDELVSRAMDFQRIQFNITNQERVLHEFQIGIQSIAAVGDYLLFLEPENIDRKNKTALISFIDLKFLRSAIGNSKLPIFRLPVPLSDDELAAADDLKFQKKGNVILVGSHALPMDMISYFSTLQQLLFNTTVSLVDPRFYEDVQKICNDIFDGFVQGLREKQMDLKIQFDRAGLTQSYVERFVEALKVEMQGRKKIGPAVDNKAQQEVVDRLSEETLKEIDDVVLRNLQEAGVWDKDKYPDLFRLNNEDRQAFQREAMQKLNGKVPDAIHDRIKTVQKFAHSLSKEQAVQQAIRDYAKWQAKRRGILARMSLFWTRMTKPQPLGAARIERALGIVGGSIIKRQNIGGSLAEGLRQVFDSRIAQVSTTMLVGAAAAQAMPEAAAYFYANALNVGQQASEWVGLFWTHVANMWGASWAWLKPDTLMTKLFSGNNPHKIAIGLGSLFATLLGYAGVIHTTVNSFLFVKGAVNEGYRGIVARGRGFFSGMKNYFLEYVSTERQKHLEALAKANERRAGSDQEVTQDAIDKAERMVGEAVKEDQLNASLFTRMRSWKIMNIFKGQGGEPKTLASAFRSFLLSEWSWTHTARVNGRMWNPWFLFRNIFFKPRTWMSMLTYPQMFNYYVNKGQSGHFPTVYNGGKTSLVDKATAMVIRTSLISDYQGDDETPSTRDLFNEGLKELKSWEESVIPAEANIQKAVINKTFQQLIALAARDPELLDWWTKVATDQNKAWISKATDSRLLSLPKKYRIYARAYQKELLDRSLRAFFASRAGLGSADGLSDKDIKDAGVAQSMNPDLSEADADQLVERIATDPVVHLYAQRTAFDFTKGFWQRQKIKHLMKIEKSLDPNLNYSLNRFVTAAKKLGDPVAMARATRQFFVSLFTDKPQEILFTFLFALGIDQGLLMPIQDQFMGDNSIAYLSRVLFWNGFLAGTLISLHADPWMKVQMDARMDDLGALDDIPSTDDYKKGYWNWFKQGWKKKDNSFFSNYAYSLKLTFVNMPAYFLTAFVTNLIFLGRFDLDMFINVYLGALIPLSGLAFKLDQSFEAAAKYDFGRFPKELRFTPAVQDYVSKKATRRKFMFNILNNIWLNIEGLIVGNILQGTTSQVGPRSFSRLVFGGMLPSEWLVNYVFRPLGKLGGPVEPAMNLCEYILTNKHTDAVKILPKDKR